MTRMIGAEAAEPTSRYRFDVDAHLVPALAITLIVMTASDIVDQLQVYALGGRDANATRAVLLIVSGILFAVALRRIADVARALAANPLIASLLALAVASTMWSIDPQTTGVRLVPLLATSLFSVYIGATQPLRRVIELFALGFAALAFVNFLAIIVFAGARGAGHSAWPDSWRGFHVHKNGMGRMIVIGVLLCLYAAPNARGQTRWLLIASIPVNLLMISMTGSRSAAINLVAAVAFGMSGLMMRHALRRWLAMVYVVVAGLVATVWLLFSSGAAAAILTALGRKITLSGRTEIWDVLLQYFIPTRPWLGHGYSAFWDENSPRMLVFATLNHYVPAHSHNGFMETILMFGVVGLCLLSLLIISYIYSLFSYSRAFPKDDVTVALTVFIIVYCSINMTEATIFNRFDALWIIFISFAAAIGLLRRMARQVPQRPIAA